MCKFFCFLLPVLVNKDHNELERERERERDKVVSPKEKELKIIHLFHHKRQKYNERKQHKINCLHKTCDYRVLAR